MKIFLIRHGESEANAKNIHQGQRVDAGLSEKGREQARKIAERLKNEKIESIYSSDLKRARETAEEIAKQHGLKVIFDKRLREFDSGHFLKGKEDWQKWTDYRKKEAARLGIKQWEVIMPGGESESNHIERVKSFIEDAKKHKCNIAVIAHGGTNKLLFGITGHTPMDKMYEQPQDNTCLNEFEFDEKSKTWKVHRINCTKHLD